MFKGSIIKKCISLVMVIAVLMGIAAPASAATAELLDDSKIGYVALGDAITGGYGLEQEETRYHQIVAEKLGCKDDYTREFGNRWRAEELRYLLDNDYKGDGYTKQFRTLGSRRTIIQNAVKDAEVVTVQIGVNNFATYFIEQLMNYLDPTKTPYEYDFDQITEELFDFQDEFSADEITNAVATVREAVMEQLLAAAPDEGDIALEFIEYAIEVATYSLLSYVTSFNGMVNAIYELNPNVDLYVIGIYNPAAGEVLTYRTEDHVVAGELIKGREIEIPIGDAIGAVIELANSYAQILAPRAFHYTYVDPGTPVTLIDKMADKALPLDERIPVAVKNALLYASEETAVTLIQELFAEYGISKTYKEALAIAQEIVNCKTDQLRDQYILTTVNNLVVEEAIKLFHEKMKEYVGDFGTVPVTDEEISELLENLTNAHENGGDTTEVATEFVESLMKDPDVIKMAAANKIYEYVVQYGLSDFVTVDNVEDLITILDDPNNDHDDRMDAVHGWMNGLAVSFIYDYVSAYNADYEYGQAADMLAMMEKPEGQYIGMTPNEIAIEFLANAFAPVVQDKFEKNGYALQGFGGNYVDFTKAVFNDTSMDVFRSELNAAAANKYAKDFAGGDATFAAELVGMLNALQGAADREAAYDGWVSTITSGNKILYESEFMRKSLLGLYETEYLPAATAVVNTFEAYRLGVLNAIDSLTQYVSMKGTVAGTIVSEYEAALAANNGNPLFGEDNGFGYVDDPAVTQKAVSGILDGFDLYYAAIEKCYASCDALTDKFDKVFAKLAQIAEVDEICLNDLLEVAKKAAVKGTSYIEEMIGNLMQGDSIMTAEYTVAYLALAYYFADGIMHLPSEEGHKIMANQVIKAIKGEPTNSTTGWLANLVIDKMIDIYHMPTSASGQKNPLINPDSYVAFGDNITLGSGTAVGADETYVKLLADALAMEYKDTGDFDSDVILNLSLAGMRTEELLAIVDGTYNGDAYTDARFDIEELRNLYLAQIKDLDLVTINVGINNLVTYPLTQALLAYNGKTPYEMDWERYLGKELNSKVTSGKNAVMDLLNHIVHNDSTCETTLNTVATAVEAIAYSLVGYIVNLDCAVEKIHNSNPDAVIVLTEFYNPLLDTYFTTPGTITLKNLLTGGEKTVELKQYQIDVSDIADGLINLANRFLTGYVGGYKNGVVARVEDSNIVTVPLNETPLDIDPSVSKDLSDLVEVITVNVAGRDITIKVPEYLKEAVATGGVALHPNAEGHKYIYEQILKALEFEIYADVIVDDLHITYGEADPSTNDYLAYIDDLSSLYDITINSITHAGAHMTERGWCDAGVYALIVDYSFEDGYKEIDHEWGYLHIDKLETEITVSVKNGDIQVTNWGNVLEADKDEVLKNLSLSSGKVICTSDLIANNYVLTISADTEDIVIGQIKLTNNSLNLEDEIFYNFKYTITGFNMDQVVEIGLLRFPTKTADVKDSNINTPGVIKYVWGTSEENSLMDGSKYVSRTEGIPAKDMGDDDWYRAYVLLKNGEYVYSNRTVFSAVRYSQTVFNNNYPSDLRALCVSLMDYGAAAQAYFKSKGEYDYTLPMNDFLNDEAYKVHRELVKPFSDDMIDDRLPARYSSYGEFDNRCMDIVSNTISLSLEGAIMINAKNFTYSGFDNVTETGFIFWNHDVFSSKETLTWDNAYMIIKNETTSSSGTISASCTGIASDQLDDTYVGVAYVYAGGTYYYGGVNRFSVDYYADTIINGRYGAAMVNLAKYIVVYGEYADKYFK